LVAALLSPLFPWHNQHAPFLPCDFFFFPPAVVSSAFLGLPITGSVLVPGENWPSPMRPPFTAFIFLSLLSSSTGIEETLMFASCISSHTPLRTAPESVYYRSSPLLPAQVPALPSSPPRARVPQSLLFLCRRFSSLRESSFSPFEARPLQKTGHDRGGASFCAQIDPPDPSHQNYLEPAYGPLPMSEVKGTPGGIFSALSLTPEPFIRLHLFFPLSGR